MAAAPVSPKRYTADDLLEMEDEGSGYEVVDGELVERVMSHESSWIGNNLNQELANFVRPQKLGRVYGSDLGLDIFPDRHLRRPDGAFVAASRLPSTRRGNLKVAPDLAFEVISPGELAREVFVKVEEYLNAGIRLVWVVVPDTQQVYVFAKGRDVQVRRADDTLDGGEVLPGFSCRVGELFE